MNKDDEFNIDNKKYFHVSFNTDNPDRYKNILTMIGEMIMVL